MCSSRLLPSSTSLWLLAITFSFLFFAVVHGSSSSTTPPARVLAALQQSSSSCGTPDPFVQAAPLAVALSCREGVVFLAAHTPEPLQKRQATNDEHRGPTTTTEQPTTTAELRPPQQQQRIHAIADGIVLLPCGWRADGMRIVDRARAVARNQTALWGSPLVDSALPLELSRTILARCAAQSAVRTCSTYMCVCVCVCVCPGILCVRGERLRFEGEPGACME